MAAPACRLLSTCRMFERLNFTGPISTSSRFHSAHYRGHQGEVSVPKRCVAAALHPQPQSVCGSVAGPVSVPRRSHYWYTDKRISGNLGAVGVAKVDPDFTPITDQTESQELAQMVNSTVERGEQGRLFAVVSLNGTQRKITTEDVVAIEEEFAPTVGDRIRLEKVLLVGGKDFTLLGQPILSRDQVRVEATVIEKTLSHNQVWSTYKRRKRVRKLKLFRTPHTMVVINRIEVGPVPEA
ncbi:hypothetical protein ACOMHN_047750 [Nucella lapillus]